MQARKGAMLIHTGFTKEFGLVKGESRLTSARVKYPDFSILLDTDLPVFAP